MKYELYLNKAVIRKKKKGQDWGGGQGRASQILQDLSGFTETLVLLQANWQTLEVLEQESYMIWLLV